MVDTAIEVAAPEERGQWDPALSRFHPAVATWFSRRFPDGPTEPQRRGWSAIADGLDTLISAPTGSGKTLSGFLVAIDALYRAHEAGMDITGRTNVVYVSPLKALAVDIAENLEQPLVEIATIAAEMGYTPAPLTLGVRTGDTSPAARARMVRNPPNIVITTPESLYLLVTSAKGREMLATTETVIVDEIHAIAKDKRGAHLAITLERLEALCGARPTRIGLSATQRPIEVVGHLLVGNRPSPSIVDVGHLRELDVALELPKGELEAVADASQVAEMLDRIADLVRAHRTTLVFVNTRRMAERIAHQLAERLGDDVVSAHHGSLSKERRHRVESRLRAGDLRALVATASLELGIDVGPVDLVCQIGSPRSIATFLQRVGRSNHHRHGVPVGRCFPLTRDELIECAALLAAVRAGRLDAIVASRLPLDIVAQQIVAEVAASDWSSDGLFQLLRRAAPCDQLTRNVYDEVLGLVSNGIETGRGRRGAYIHHDAVNGELRARKGARLAAITSGGAIPESGDYRVVAEPGDMPVGTVNEDFAVESMAGDIFLLGTHSWQIRNVEPGVVRVRDAGDTPPTVPFWLGEAPARTGELSDEISSLRGHVDAYLARGEREEATRWVLETCGVDVDVATMIVEYLAAGRAVLGIIPTKNDLVFERFFDDTGGMQLVVHSPMGGRINRALGLALRKRFCRTFDFELQAAATDDAVVLSLGPHHSFPLEEVPRYLSADALTDVLEHAVLDAPMFQARWRWNLNRALMVLRFRNGRRNPPPIQRMESDDLLAAVFPQAIACRDGAVGPIEIPDHLLVRQAMDDTLHEALDVDGLKGVLEEIDSGAISLHFCETTEPSVFSHEILTARPYAFLDDEEFQNRRTNAVQIRRGLPVDLTNIGALSTDAIERVHREIDPMPETPDDLHDLLFSMVAMRARSDWEGLFAHLESRNRAIVVLAESKDALWVTAEGVCEAHAALEGSDAAVVRMIRGHLELIGITTVDDLVTKTTLPHGRVAFALAALEAEGFAMRGHYREHAIGEEWVARRLLARMHSYAKRARRHHADPVSAQDLMRFLLRWQHVAPEAQLSGETGLLAILEQLQGHEAAAATWERELIARRLRHYDPAWLDGLCHAGDVAWLRLRPRAADDPTVPSTASPSKATPTSVVLRPDLPWLLKASRGDDPSLPRAGATAEVVEFLRERGASFATECAAATGRLPEDVERALWDGVARGLIMCDGFAAIRSKVRDSTRASHRVRQSRLRRSLTGTARSAGRWSVVPELDSTIDTYDLAEAVAEQLLARWGIVFHDLVARERLQVPWREILGALRRLEDRGVIRGGRYVSGFSGEQYALPAAADLLEAVRTTPLRNERVVVNGTDPLNLVGVIVTGATVPTVRTNSIVFVDGVPDAVERERSSTSFF